VLYRLRVLTYKVAVLTSPLGAPRPNRDGVPAF
jgi:hypothetical protein